MGIQRKRPSQCSSGNKSSAPSPEPDDSVIPTNTNGPFGGTGSHGSSREKTPEKDADKSDDSDDPDKPDCSDNPVAPVAPVDPVDPVGPVGAVVPFDEANRQFPRFPDLPSEVRRMIWANAAGYDVNSPRIIEVRIRTSTAQRVHPIFDITTFRLDSTQGPYQAPNRGAIANRESRDLYNIRFPHQLRFDRAQVRVAGELMEYRDHLGQRIDFDANRDTIFMDYPTLEYLFTARFELRGLVGFDQIRRLATTFDDNNIRGIQNFLLHRRGALSNVVDIRQVFNVDVVIRDREQAEQYAERTTGRVLLPNDNQPMQHFFLPVLSRTEFLNLYPSVAEK